ncbi:MAG: hypothetical protein ACTHK7_02010 [Aureliella sp.]
MVSKVRKVAWPKFKFLETGPKLKGPFPSLGFGWELDYYHFLHRWNGGVPLADSFKVKSWRGEDTVARVRYFYGISQDRADGRDLRDAVYFDWDALPRGALPIAALNIEEDDWDLCTLLTFRWGDHFNRLYLLADLHEGGPYDPDDRSRLQLVATSLPQFMKSLRPNEYFVYRTWFQIPVPAEELENVAAAFLESDFEDYYGFTDIADSQCGQARHDELNFDVWLAHSNAKIRDIASPKKVAKDSCILAIDAFRWQHPTAQKQVAAILKPLGLDRKLKKLGETPIRIDERRTKP